MAFAKQYYSSYISNNGLDYYLEIWVDGYTGGNPSEISIGNGGPVISYDTDSEDRFSPIISSTLSLPMMITGVGTESFIRQLREVYTERQIYIHLYRNNSTDYATTKPLWSGFLVMDISTGLDMSFPYEQNLTFIDGLSLLKDIDFVDLNVIGGNPPYSERSQGNYDQENMYYGPANYIFWIREILLKSGASLKNASGYPDNGVSQNYGITTAVNWYNLLMPNVNQGTDPLLYTKCSVQMFHTKSEDDLYTPKNCYEVLVELLRHWGARITYWKGEFWIVQIPEYITNESGTLDNPENINSRQYDYNGALISSQDHLGSTYWTRYEQTIQNNKVSKLTGTKYDYLPMIKRVNGNFLSHASKNYFGGFPFGSTAESSFVFQGTIENPSSGDYMYMSIPLDWNWNMSGSLLVNGHTNGWWCSVKFNFVAKSGATEYYLQQAADLSFYWETANNFIPLGPRSPKYVIKSFNPIETNYIGFNSDLPFLDSSGDPIVMTGAWNFYLDIENYGTSSNNPGSFFCRFSGYGSTPATMRNPNTAISLLWTATNPSTTTSSGTVSWSNSLVNSALGVGLVPLSNPGGQNILIDYVENSPFNGILQIFATAQGATFGETLNITQTNNNNTEVFSFGNLLWGDAVQGSAVGALQVNTASPANPTFVKTDPNGKWGRGILTGEKTFTEMLLEEFLTGQIQVIISPSMRLTVGEENKNVTINNVTRPRFINPIGKFRESRNGPDPVYIFKRGAFYSLSDEWDYEGFQIIRTTLTNTTTTTNTIGGIGTAQDNDPITHAKIQAPILDALSKNSPIAYVSNKISATGSNDAVNGNFNTAANWTLGTGWVVSGNKAGFTATGSLSDLTQTNLVDGSTYQIIFTAIITTGALLVKAGNTGASLSITSSGQYSIYLLCEGNTSLTFQAGTTFSGSVSQVRYAKQQNLTSVPIYPLNDAVLKINDVFNIYNTESGESIPLTVNANQLANDKTISVVTYPLLDDIGENSYLLINQDDLAAQYQNKTKGTVGAFDITATSIDSGSVAISSYIDDDTFATASVNSLATSESIKAYVDGQAGHDETLQQVTDNGNTTTNSIMIGSSSSPSSKLEISDTTVGTTPTDNDNLFIKLSNKSVTSVGETWGIGFNSNNAGTDKLGAFVSAFGHYSANYNTSLIFGTRDTSGNASEKMRLTDSGQLLVGLTSSSNIVAFKDVADIEFDLNGSDAAMNFNSIWRTGVKASESSFRFAESNTSLGANVRMTIETGGQITLPSYGSGSFTGAETYFLAVTSGGDVVEADSSALPGGPYLPLTGGTLSGDLQIDGGDLTIIKQNDAPTITLLHDGTNPSTNDLLFKMQFQSDYDGSHQNWGKIEVDTNASSVRTNMDFYVKSLSGAEQLALRLEGQPSNVPNTFIYGSLIGTTATFSGLGTFNAGIEIVRASNNNQLKLKRTTSATGEFNIFTNTNKLFFNNVATNTYPLTIDASDNATFSGNLGINTTSPAAKITIIGSGENGGILFNNAGSQEHRFYSYQNYQFNAIGSSDPVWNWVQFTGVGVTPTYKMTLNNTGLSITGGATLTGSLTGTTATFNGNIVANSIFLFDSSSNDRNVLDLDSSDNLQIATGTSTGARSIRFLTENTEKMVITSGGNLGVGVSSPHTLLNINDNNVAGEAQFGIGDISSYYLAMGHNSAGFTDGFIGTVYNNDAARFDIRMKGTALSDSKVTILGSGAVAFGGATNYGTSGQLLKSNANASPAWVDASSVIGGPYLPLTGGTLTGALTGTSATFSNGFSSDGTAKNYVWRIPNTSSNNGFWYKICRVTSSQSTRFKLQMVGGHSYSDGIYSSEINAYGQLNNDNNYDLIFHQLEKSGQTGNPVISFGQVDIDNASTDLYVRLNTFAELVITASISQGNLYPDSTSTGNSTTPTDFVSALQQFGMLSNATFAGSLTGTTATFSGDIITSNNFITDNATLGSLSLKISGTLTGRLDNYNSALRLINFDASSETLIQGNGDISIKSIGSNNIKFFTSNAEKARITSGGNLGLGTTNPSKKLSIVGNDSTGIIQHLEGSTSAGATIRFSRGGSYTWQTGVGGNATGNDIPFSSFGIVEGSTSRLVIGVGGQLKLPAYGSGSFTGAETYFLAVTSGGDVVEADSSALPGGPYLPLTGGTLTGDLLISKSIESQVKVNETTNNHFINIYQQANDSYIIAGKASGTPTQNLRFYTGGSNSMVLTSGGNLGIGTTSINNPLTVSKDAGGNAIAYFNSLNANGYGVAIQTADNGNDKYVLRLASAYSSTPIMYASNAGNVGINQANPTEKLHVVGDALITGDSHADAFKPAATGEPIKFKNFGSTEVGRFTDGGNFGVNKSNPVYKVDIGGTLRSKPISQVTNVSGKLILASNQLNVTTIGAIIGTISFTSDDSDDGPDFEVGKIEVVNQNPYGLRNDMTFTTRGQSDVSERMRILWSGGLAFGGAANYGTAGQILQTNANASPTWVDASSVIGGPYLPLTGGTLTGALEIGYSDARLKGGDLSGRFVVSNSDTTSYITLNGTNNSSPNSISIITDTDIRFNTGSSYGEAMRITADSNILIGTTTDSGEKLQVTGAIKMPYNASNLYYYSQNNGNIGFGKMFPFDNNGFYSFDTNFTLANGGYKFKYNGSEKMRLTSGGSLLLGTTTDSGAKLSVEGDVLVGSASKTSATHLSIDSDTNNNAGIKINRGGLTKWILYNPSGTNNFKIYDNTGGASFTMEVGGAATFTGLVSGITPTVAANFTTKAYVDAQVGANDTLQEVTDNGNTTTNSIMIGSSSSPSVKLAVYDTSTPKIHLQNATSGITSSDGFQIALSGANGYLWNWENGSIIFGANNAERMRLTATGRLGIGITSPTELLHLRSGNPVLQIMTNSGADGQTSATMGRIIGQARGYSMAGAEMCSVDFETNASTWYKGEIVFKTNNTDGTNGSINAVERMRITAPGGIAFGGATNYGTSGQLLKSNANASPTWVDASSVIGGPYLPLTAGSSKQLTDALWLGGTTNGTRKIFFTNSGSYAKGFFDAGAYGFQVVGSEKMTLTSNGNLLLGTTVDGGNKLSIKASSSTEAVFGISYSTATTNFFEVGVVSHDSYLTLKNSGGTETIKLNSDGNSYFNGGNVGIGNANPTVALEVGVNSTGNTKRVIFNSEGGNATNLILKSRTNRSTLILSDNDTTVYFVAEGSKSSWGFGSNVNSSNNILIDNSGNVAIGSTITNSGAKLHITGIIRTTGGSVQAGQDYGFTLQDESNNNRYGLKFGAAGSVGGSNLLMLTNRSISGATGGGEVAIAANASTTGVTETEVMRIKAVTQSEVSIDGVLSLTAQQVPADPPNNKSVIWMDSSSGDLKVKITSSNETVTRTIAVFD